MTGQPNSSQRPWRDSTRPPGNTAASTAGGRKNHIHPLTSITAAQCAPGHGCAVASVAPQACTANSASGTVENAASNAPTIRPGRRHASTSPRTTGIAAASAISASAHPGGRSAPSATQRTTKAATPRAATAAAAARPDRMPTSSASYGAAVMRAGTEIGQDRRRDRAQAWLAEGPPTGASARDLHRGSASGSTETRQPPVDGSPCTFLQVRRSRLSGSNRRPAAYKAAALPTELRRRTVPMVRRFMRSGDRAWRPARCG